MDVEDDTAGEDGVDHTGQSAHEWDIGYMFHETNPHTNGPHKMMARLWHVKRISG